MTDARTWITNFVNNPFLKQQQALVIEGPQGSGKTVFCKLLLKVTRFEHPTVQHIHVDNRSFMGSFGGVNEFADKNLAIFDEPSLKIGDRLKNLIANRTFERDRQMQERDTVTIPTNFIITTNYASRMNTEGSRRFIIVNPVTAFALLSSI